MNKSHVNWTAIAADPRFRSLHRKKSRFLWSLMIFSMVYYFLLPIMAAYFKDLFNTQVWGPINFGLLFALSEFVIAWAIAIIYARRANREFDAIAQALVSDAHTIGS